MSFSKFICNDILGIYNYETVFMIIFAATPFLVLFSVIESYLKGFQRLNTIIRLNVVTSIVNIIIIFPILQYFNIYGVSVYFFIISIIPIVYYLYLDWDNLKNILFKILRINIEPIKIILKIGLVSLYSSLLFQISVLHLRKFIIIYFNIHDAGIYQSLLGLSTNYFMIIFSFLSYYTLPKISSLISNDEISSELNQQLRFLLFIIVPMVIIVLSFRNYFIKIFYSNDFIQVTDLFYFQLLGDFAKSLGALFGIWLIPKIKIKVLIFIDTLFNLILIFLPYLVYNYYSQNIIIIPFTYMIAFSTHFILVYLYSKHSLKFKFDIKTLQSLLISVCSLLIAYVSNIYFPNIAVYIILVIIAVNSYFILNKNEIIKLKQILLNFSK